MNDEASEPVEPVAPIEGETPARPRRSRWRRYGLGTLALVTAIVSGLLVSFFSIDLGPSLREVAEKQGSKGLGRPIHIGKLKALLVPGRFEVEDLMIEGLKPTDRPFFKAKKITLDLPWWSILSHELVVEDVTMTDWEMLVEQFDGGRNNFAWPKKDPNKPKKKSPWEFTTTVTAVVAERGMFTYEDHVTPWTTVSRNIRVSVYKSMFFGNYRGTLSSSNGTVKIQNYEAFRTDLQTRFAVEKGLIKLDRIDLSSDGSRSIVDGYVDTSRWPEQKYNVRSVIDFPLEKGIFFHGQNFKASGTGNFTGTFHLYKGGRELKGKFTSPLAGVSIAGGSEWKFPNLNGDVLWLSDRLEITNVKSGLLGGRAEFDYKLAPFGVKGKPTIALWDARYADVDLVQLTDFLETQGIRLSGRITGHNRIEWPNGKWGDGVWEGNVTAQAPAGTRVQGRTLVPADVAHQIELPPEAGPFNPHQSIGYVPIGGQIAYKVNPSWITVAPGSWAATPRTYVEFGGRTAFGERSEIPFHVTSLDWQESDRVLAGIMTAFGSPTGQTEMSGFGEFDGVMLKSFGRPRIEGKFRGERMRAWDVNWGAGTADLAIENSYVNIFSSSIKSGDSEITAKGKFSLGYPRKDNGEEINADVVLNRRPLADLRHAFALDDWPVDGVVSGEYHLYGNFETPFGAGKLLIEDGVAYGETFESATATLKFEGKGVRLETFTAKKSTGSMTGSAWVGWEGDYSFSADGHRIPVESLKTLTFPQAPLSGLLEFKASGTGTFDEPRYDVNVSVADLFIRDEGVGALDGRLGLRGELLTSDFRIASNRLNLVGNARVAMTPEMDADVTLRFRDSSLDPYVRLFAPKLSPYATAVAGGTIRVVGELMDVDQLVVTASVEQLDMKLLDYALHNSCATPAEGERCPIELSLDHHTAKIDQLHLAGKDTLLTLDGSVGLHDSTLDVRASGDTNLGILQLFSRDVRSSGAASLSAKVTGTFDNPQFSGSATFNDARLRVLPLNSLEGINGRITFERDVIRVNDLRARLAGGDVQFGGRVTLSGFTAADVNVTLNGQGMRFNYPEGFRSTVDADLTLHGTPDDLVLSGNVGVQNAIYTKPFEATPEFFSFGGARTEVAFAAPPATTIPLRYEVQISAPRSLRVENNLMRLVASADLQLRGTYDRPQITGHAEIDRGDIYFEANRYFITRGSIDFSNPSRIDPYFDVEAETRVRVPNQTYRVTIGVIGSTGTGMSFNFNSDPSLDPGSIIGLLLGQQTDLEQAEMRRINAALAAQSDQQLMQMLIARAAVNPLMSGISKPLTRTGINAQLAPSIDTENATLSASARLILGTRLSDRAYLTFTRSLGSTSRDQIIVLEYDQTDRLGWVLTQNSSGTFSLDFRVRHSF